MPKAHREVMLGIDSATCYGVSCDNRVGCYLVVGIGPPNCCHVVVGCKATDRCRTPASIIRGVSILIELLILIISTIVLFVSIAIVPIVIVFPANTVIVTIALRVPITLVLDKLLIRLSTVALWFHSPN